jgi:hypothetical protein
VGREKANAYQRHPKIILGDQKVLAMEWDARGMHNWLLDLSWQEDPRGTIPDDECIIRRWLNLDRPGDDEAWARVWKQLEPCWPIVSPGRRGNQGMLRTSERQERYSEANSRIAQERYGKTVSKPCTNRAPNGARIVHERYIDINPKPLHKPKEEQNHSSSNADPDSGANYEQRVRAIQHAWPLVDRSVLTESFILDAFEEEVVVRAVSREEASLYVTERCLEIAELLKAWPKDQRRYWPALKNFITERAYNRPNEAWERKEQPAAASARQRRVNDAIDQAFS